MSTNFFRMSKFSVYQLSLGTFSPYVFQSTFMFSNSFNFHVKEMLELENKNYSVPYSNIREELRIVKFRVQSVHSYVNYTLEKHLLRCHNNL